MKGRTHCHTLINFFCCWWRCLKWFDLCPVHYRVLLSYTTGKRHATGLQTGVIHRAVEIFILRPVWVIIHSATQELQWHKQRFTTLHDNKGENCNLHSEYFTFSAYLFDPRFTVLLIIPIIMNICNIYYIYIFTFFCTKSITFSKSMSSRYNTIAFFISSSVLCRTWDRVRDKLIKWSFKSNLVINYKSAGVTVYQVWEEKAQNSSSNLQEYDDQQSS